MGKTLTSAELIQILERVKDECGSEIDDTAGAGDTTKVWSADKTNSELSNLNSALKKTIYGDGVKDPELWESGGIRQADAVNVANNARIRTINTISANDYLSYKSINDYSCCIYAWNDEGVYIGVLQSNGNYEKSTSSIAWVTQYEFEMGYQYRLVMRKTTNTSQTLTKNDGLNCVFFENNVQNLLDDFAEAKVNSAALENSIKGLDIQYRKIFRNAFFGGWKMQVLELNGVKPELLLASADKSIEQSISNGDDPIQFALGPRKGTIKKMKVQGSSSVRFPKKNYTLTFSEKFTAVDGWEISDKYVIKSNFNDFTQARNVCCAKLWGGISKTRSEDAQTDICVDSNNNFLADSSGAYLQGTTQPPFNIGGNYGAIDGVPMIVVINGEYWGLYSFNTPKDAVMAKMDGTYENECIVSCGGYSLTNAEYFKAEATMQPDANDVTDFEVEHSDSMTDGEILTSINRAINSTLASYQSTSEMLETINQYVDINSATDYFILASLIGNTDGIGKNYLLDTWDGVKWFFVPYDMDMVFGNDQWDGTVVGNPVNGFSFARIASLHNLFYIIYSYDRERFISRYKELRGGVLSEGNVYAVIGGIINQIPRSSYDYESLRWINTPGTSVKDFNQICNWYRLRCEYLDAEIAELEQSV